MIIGSIIAFFAERMGFTLNFSKSIHDQLKKHKENIIGPSAIYAYSNGHNGHFCEFK